MVNVCKCYHIWHTWILWECFVSCRFHGFFRCQESAAEAPKDQVHPSGDQWLACKGKGRKATVAFHVSLYHSRERFSYVFLCFPMLSYVFLCFPIFSRYSLFPLSKSQSDTGDPDCTEPPQDRVWCSSIRDSNKVDSVPTDGSSMVPNRGKHTKNDGQITMFHGKIHELNGYVQ